MAVGSEDIYTHQQHTSQCSSRYTLYCYYMITFPTGEVMGLASTANLADLNTSSMAAHMHDVFILSDRQRRTDQHPTYDTNENPSSHPLLSPFSSRLINEITLKIKIKGWKNVEQRKLAGLLGFIRVVDEG